MKNTGVMEGFWWKKERKRPSERGKYLVSKQNWKHKPEKKIGIKRTPKLWGKGKGNGKGKGVKAQQTNQGY